MRFEYSLLRFAEQLDLETKGGCGLHVLHGSGRGVSAQVPAGWVSVWMPLSGVLGFESSCSEWRLEPGEAMVWRDGPLGARCRSATWWLAIAGPNAAWASHAEAQGRTGSELLPWQSGTTPELRRTMVRLARLARDGCTDSPVAAALAGALCASLMDQQAELHGLLARCSGRTLDRRRQTLLRLLRVRHLIQTHPETKIDLVTLAERANYSPCHLIRIYRDVFGETPSEYAARLRTHRAWNMVCDTTIPICEITEALGFESQSAFCRSFKKSFGLTATEARRRHAEPLAA